MVHPNQEMQDLEVEIVEAEVVMVATGAAASEVVVVVVSAGETVEATEVVVAAEDSEGATKWVEEVTAEMTDETGHTKRRADGNHCSPGVRHERRV